SQQRLQGPQLPDLAQLVEEVVQPELLLAQLPLEFRRLLFVVGTLGLLDQGHDVAHPKDSLSHALGMETFELIEFLARRGEQNRLSGNRLDRESRAPASVSVELG